MATIGAEHVAGGDTALFESLVDCYLRWDPATDPDEVLRTAADTPTGGASIEASGLFGTMEIRRFEWEATYATAAYLRLLSTYSGHIALADDSRRGLLDCIAARIDALGGRITKRYLSELLVAYRG